MEKNKENIPENNISPEEVEQLRAKVAELEGMRERLLLSAADFENAKKRLSRERDDFAKFSQENLLRDLIPVLDNFERAISHASQSKLEGPAKSVVMGIEMVLKQMTEILKNQGLKRMTTVGQLFDPHQHEAIAHVQGEGRDNEIIDEIEPGYTLHDRLLRAAKVRVRHTALPASEQSEEKTDELT